MIEYLKILTVQQAIESKGEKYREPDVGKCLKGEKHPLAETFTLVSWMLKLKRKFKTKHLHDSFNKNDRPGDDGTLRRVIFGSIVKNHRIETRAI